MMHTNACTKAHEMKHEMEDLIHKGTTPTIAQMAEYNAVVDFCHNMKGHSGEHAYAEEAPVLDDAAAKRWVSMMHHEVSGNTVKGQHWSMEDVMNVAKAHNIEFEHITPRELYVVMNMMWHDHYKSAVAANMVDKVDFYVYLAKDYLFDEDGISPHEKLMGYYNLLHKHGKA